MPSTVCLFGKKARTWSPVGKQPVLGMSSVSEGPMKRPGKDLFKKEQVSALERQVAGAPEAQRRRAAANSPESQKPPHVEQSRAMFHGLTIPSAGVGKRTAMIPSFWRIWEGKSKFCWRFVTNFLRKYGTCPTRLSGGLLAGNGKCVPVSAMRCPRNGSGSQRF